MNPAPAESVNLIKHVLGENYLHLDIGTLFLEDNMQGQCQAEVLLKDVVIKGTGVGQVSAIFNAFKSYYAGEYQSLKSIELIDFRVTINKCVGDEGNQADGTTSQCHVELKIKNSFGYYFSFEDASASLAASSGRTVAAVAEFFINSERAYVTLYRALEDARARNRQDLVTRYTTELSLVVKSTSYTEIIERTSKEIS